MPPKHWKYAGFAVLLTLAWACTIPLPGGSPSAAQTPAQAFYEAYGAYNEVYATAVAWAESPAGQAHPEAIRAIVKARDEVNAALDKAAAMFCLAGEPTLDSPAPAPSPDCVPITGSDADAQVAVLAALIRSGSAELRRVLAENGG